MAAIGVVGLGAMGLGIAQVFAAAGFTTTATDSHAPARDSAKARIAEGLAARVVAGKLSEVDRDSTLANLIVVESLADFAPCDLVIEAIVERADAKQALFAQLESIVARHTILATNTSSISVASIASTAKIPERILAMHFFNPPTAMKLVELVPHSGTAADALALARSIAEAAGKTVVHCPDRPGFIVNRCARPYYGEALALLEEGVAASHIDAAMLAAGYRLGPFALIDLIGADINLAATLGLGAAMNHHPRYHAFAVLRDQVAAGHLGRKSGQGFVFPAKTEAAADPAIVLRIEAMLVNEAAWLLAEGGTSARGIDTAIQLGLNFPRGPFQALALHGKPTILATLAALEAAAPPFLKTRYLPAPALELS
jgi:3-hydroxybutyryl-CoA dehydrogenase